jgi:nucleotide-binding universal stress UspA family protein
MTLVVAPVRYPLTNHSKATVETAIQVARDRDADLSVVHINLYQENRRVTRSALREAVEASVSGLPRTRYVVTQGLLVEESILDEVVAQDADVVVIGSKQVGRWRSMIQRIVDDVDVERFLREELDCEVITADR